MVKGEKVAIVGSGLIGRYWAMLFAGAGYSVTLYDIAESQVSSALEDIQKQLKMIESSGLLRGDLSVEEQFSLISGSNDLKECLKNAKHIQECVPESVPLKQKVLGDLDNFVSDDQVISSSTSCLLPSILSENLKHRKQFLVSHPINPPYFVRLVEIVPAPWTDSSVLARTRALMEEIGQAPVVFKKETLGFAVNRIQYAILNESINLVKDGYLDVKDVDTVMAEGLGARYAFIGPLEVAHLNADGMDDYVERYGKGVMDVSATLGSVPEWKKDNFDMKEIHKQLCEMCPLDKLSDRRQWRNDCLVDLAKVKRNVTEK